MGIGEIPQPDPNEAKTTSQGTAVQNEQGSPTLLFEPDYDSLQTEHDLPGTMITADELTRG
ncbi:MAG TPA: hypothetical protein PKU78_04780 [Candidatus Dojkabacteria bacterium]|nr:hypothetical protein [Candidatus Dojkabacteria bacterium]HRO65508.1 hypothetical protein [Candidatus Dojkabacteria bacterium]HRP51350.1 hypothetical protein [Candidatus Dojkabacteria bacterium]